MKVEEKGGDGTVLEEKKLKTLAAKFKLWALDPDLNKPTVKTPS